MLRVPGLDFPRVQTGSHVARPWPGESPRSTVATDDGVQGRTPTALGGLNQLRGYDFREFFGTRIALDAIFELRFPLIDRALDFPVHGAGATCAGFLFFDVGAAWFINDSLVRPRAAKRALQDRPPDGRGRSTSEVWDSENDRFQDRADRFTGSVFQLLSSWEDCSSISCLVESDRLTRSTCSMGDVTNCRAGRGSRGSKNARSNGSTTPSSTSPSTGR